MTEYRAIFVPVDTKLEEEREGKLGVSDLSSVENLEWGCQRRLWYRIRRVAKDFPSENKAEFERGHLTEPISRQLLRQRTGWKIDNAPMVAHPDRPWFICHQDDQIVRPDMSGVGTAEYKTIHWRVMKRFKKEGIRDAYILQMQASFAITGHTWGVFGLLCLEPWQFEWFTVERDEELITKILEDVDLFWAKVENGPIPDSLPPSDARCQTCPWRRTCQGEALAAISTPNGSQGAAQELPGIPELLPLALELKDRQEIRDEAQELVEETSAQIKALIGDKPGGMFAGGRAVLSRFTEHRWDTKALNDALTRIPLLEKYRKQNQKESMRVYWTGDK